MISAQNGQVRLLSAFMVYACLGAFSRRLIGFGGEIPIGGRLHPHLVGNTPVSENHFSESNAESSFAAGLDNERLGNVRMAHVQQIALSIQ